VVVKKAAPKKVPAKKAAGRLVKKSAGRQTASGS
jgi:hypothetical protein